ncbi:hypothetical protein MNAN1_002203 [Malassezia nana]|uniref:Tetratricopeptide repeat protein 39B n=1 Tax=Malassezia nana TaxID=180528 RepID=A0AAF0EIX0_9BASI|nr:hypothetical protein MNAN1_002203 [Malassezia nana]
MAGEQLLPSALDSDAFLSRRKSSLVSDTVLSSTTEVSQTNDLPISLTDQVMRQNILQGRAPSVRKASGSSGGMRRSSATMAQRPSLQRPLSTARAPDSTASAGDSDEALAADEEALSDNEDFFDAVAAPSSSLSSHDRKTTPAVTNTTSRPAARAHDGQLLASNAKGRAARMSKLTTRDVAQSTESLFEDIGVARKALHLFLNSRMNDAYDLVEGKSESRLYYAVAYAILSTIKAIMTFEHQDLGTAISHCKDALHVAGLLRKKQSALASFGRFVRAAGPSVAWVSSMTPVEQHAELISSECNLLKAVLGIAYSGDLLSSLTEALHLRAAYGDYRSLLKYVEWAEAHQTTVDEDFRSGVFLGSGCISLILGLLPVKVLKIMEVFGYEGSVPVGLGLLQRAAGWSSTALPARQQDTEGIRSPICDMTLLVYHLVVSTFLPVPGVDITFAEKVLNYHLQRYPEGVFFLYFHGRLYSTQALSTKAIQCFEQARDVQEEYVQLKHICYWDMALCHLSLNQWSDAYHCFTILANENNWSKALYSYARAAALYQTDAPKAQSEAAEIMERVPSMTQRIAGKSIPLEKFAARKARKLVQYGHLCLPAMELAYLTHCYTTAPRSTLLQETLPCIERELTRVQQVPQPSVDDVCLAHFLRGVVLRNLAYPEAHVQLDPNTQLPSEAASRAESSLLFVAHHAAQCEYDHYLLYFCHYELGRLYISMGRPTDAQRELDLVLSGKNLGDHGRKGKYSMQNMCVLRSHAALDLLRAPM